MAHDIGYYLARLQETGASDLHLASGVPPTLRIHGTLQRLDEPPLTAADVQGMVFQVLEPQKHHLLTELKNLDFAYESGTDAQGRPRRYRGNVYLQKNGPNLVMRSIPSEIPTLEKLGLPKTLEKLTHYHQGLVLVTGQAGSGKTSTLAALINLINQHSPHHIITIEDPIEYVFTPARALVNQRQVGRDVESFQLALKGALREDPDVIMVGELRDLETIS
ncbi:MAG TPA: ATPase, T2SS/T4P/T4SS family, partial [Candidatus Nitrosotenuis sp.]|nr:ATPase, T2SS/T4P/T4SS family [Candidatus Nitrosotenuis sp.]